MSVMTATAIASGAIGMLARHRQHQLPPVVEVEQHRPS
jgi:hypothetical protein